MPSTLREYGEGHNNMRVCSVLASNVAFFMNLSRDVTFVQTTPHGSQSHSTFAFDTHSRHNIFVRSLVVLLFVCSVCGGSAAATGATYNCRTKPNGSRNHSEIVNKVHFARDQQRISHVPFAVSMKSNQK